MPRTTTVGIVAILLATIFLEAAVANPSYSFGTSGNGRKVLRHRRARQEVPTQHHKTKWGNETTFDEEEATPFWDRVLQEQTGSLVVPAKPVTSQPIASPPISTMPATSPPTTFPPETTSPSSEPLEVAPSCPTRVEVECVEVGSGIPCQDLEPPLDDSDCLKQVEYTYRITNHGPDTEQIYTLVVVRGDRTTVVTDRPKAIPTVVLTPGEFVAAADRVELNLCEGASVLDTKADVIAGPPTSVMIQIACQSEEGVECREISTDFNTAPDPEACLLDVTYTYTIANTGDSEFNLIVFNRVRNDEFVDLMPLLGTQVFLDAGETTAVQESEQIDRCRDQTFTTSTLVTKLPPAEALCQDTGHYP